MCRFVVLLLFLNALIAELEAQGSSGVPTPEHPLIKDIGNNTNLSEIYKLLELNSYNVLLRSNNSGAMLFAPMNIAFQLTGSKIVFPKDEIFLGNHMVLGRQNYPAMYLPSELTTLTSTLYITKTANGDVFVNNAKIVPEFSKPYDIPDSSRRKILYVIDDVLIPLRFKPGGNMDNSNSISESNPNALGLLERYGDYDLATRSPLIDQPIYYDLKSFYSLIKQFNKLQMFRDPNRNTYFIPIDDGLKTVKGQIDARVIDAHVVYGKVLFVNPTPENEVFETAAFSDSTKVTISIPREIVNSVTKRRHQYVSSYSRIGYPAGRVLSEIVYPNIPVKNGVVHLIKKPLMLIDKTIKQLIDDLSLDPMISIFKDKLRHAKPSFIDKLDGSHQKITLFIPTNNAWRDFNVEKALTNNTSYLQNILDLHVLQQPLTTESARNPYSNSFATLAVKQFVLVNLVTRGTNVTLTADGGGVNATVLLADIGATNGVIHIIDRVLGVPSDTVGKKVGTDPDLSFTYELGNSIKDGQYNNFNDRLNDPRKNYTYLVPRNVAWAALKTEYPDLHKALSQPEFAYKVLERHLVEGRNLSMADLKNASNQMYVLQTKNNGLNIKVSSETQGNKGYTIFWNGNNVAVYRPDVPCINGYIHIIDRVLIHPGDFSSLPTTDSASKAFISFSTLLLFVLPVVLYH